METKTQKVATKEDVVNKICFDEFTTSKSNYSGYISDFEAALDMLECQRNEKDAEWLSDVFLPEAPSIFLTEASQEAGKYFSTRDYVDVYLEGSKPEDFASCKVAKKSLNLQLNNKRVYHYQKYMQARDINRLLGFVYAVCWWDQKVETVKVGEKQYRKPVFDESQNIIINDMGEPVFQDVTEDVFDDVVVYDHFNWMPLDPRNVFTSNKYVYSAQQEESIIIRSEQTYEELKAREQDNDYFNLELLKDEKIKSHTETETSAESFNKDDKFMKPKNEVPKWDVLERYGMHYCIVKESDHFGYPTKVEIGYDSNGLPLEKAELCHVRQTTAYRGNTKVLIRFQAEPLRDGAGVPYIPIIRGLCYVHPTKKIGMSSGKYLRELQIAINDVINLSLDRTKLSMLPTFIGNKYMMEDNDTVYIEPEHTIEMEDVAQFREMKISSDIQGGLGMYSLMRGLTQQVEAVYPNTMGEVGKASTTATAIAGADSRSNVRANYKELTFEYTFLTEFYWMILQMQWQFMHKKTIEKIFTPDEISAFKPTGDYTYQPVTSGIELEQNKNRKIANYDQIIGRLSGLAQGNPAIIPIIAYIVGEQLQLMGLEYRAIQPMIEKLFKTPMQPEEGAQPGQPKDMKPEATSNQTGLPQSNMEDQTRQGAMI